MVICEHYLFTHLSDRPFHITWNGHQNDFYGHSLTTPGLCWAPVSKCRAYYFLHSRKTAIILCSPWRRLFYYNNEQSLNQSERNFVLPKTFHRFSLFTGVYVLTFYISFTVAYLCICVLWITLMSAIIGF